MHDNVVDFRLFQNNGNYLIRKALVNNLLQYFYLIIWCTFKMTQKKYLDHKDIAQKMVQ